MIPMSCPSCGRRGNVPLDRLNTRMHCKKCDAVFHLDATGKPVLGEPPPPKGSKSAKEAGRDKNEPLDPIGIVAEKLSHTPKPIWMTAAVLLSGYVLWTLSGWFGGAPLSVEQSLGRQIHDATVAVLDNDTATLKNLTAAGTEDTLLRAVEMVRPMIADGQPTSEKVVFAAGEPVASDEEHREVEVSLIPTTGTGSYNLKLAWVKFKNKWFIDGGTTFELNEMEVATKKAAAKAKGK